MNILQSMHTKVVQVVWRNAALNILSLSVRCFLALFLSLWLMLIIIAQFRQHCTSHISNLAGVSVTEYTTANSPRSEFTRRREWLAAVRALEFHFKCHAGFPILISGRKSSYRVEFLFMGVDHIHTAVKQWMWVITQSYDSLSCRGNSYECGCVIDMCCRWYGNNMGWDDRGV